MTFGKQDYSNRLEDNETGNWNAAQAYSDLKIVRWLKAADEYQIIAENGTLELSDEFMFDENTKSVSRIRALNRLASTLMMLIENTIFAVRRDKERDALLEFKESIKFFKTMIPKVQKEIINQRDHTKQIRINETIFKIILDNLALIKQNLNQPLNEHDLIFITPDEFDPDEFKRKVAEDLINGG